jgi:hypothetical protein
MLGRGLWLMLQGQATWAHKATKAAGAGTAHMLAQVGQVSRLALGLILRDWPWPRLTSYSLKRGLTRQARPIGARPARCAYFSLRVPRPICLARWLLAAA